MKNNYLKLLNMNKDFYFNFSVSTRPYDRNKDNAAFLKWYETNGDITTLSQYISEGFAYCNCFYHEEGTTFSNKLKNDENVKSANLICLDLDAVRLTYNEFVTLMEQTEIKPNIVYTTQNNGYFKPNKDEEYNNRYRAIYVIDMPIYDDTLYKDLHMAIKDEVRIITEDKNIFNDNTDNNISHFFAGCKGTTITTDENIYSLTWLMERYGISADNGNDKRNNNKKKSDKRTNNKGKNTTPQSATRNNNKDKEMQSATRNNNKDEETPQDGGKHTYITDYFRRKLNEFQSATRYNIKKERKSIIQSSCTFSEEEERFIQDYYNLSFSDLIHEYIRTYPSIECTQIDYDDTTEIITLPSDYTEIKRRWYLEEVEKDNGQTYNLGNVHKTRNGEGRRNLLFKNLLIRKRILPQISFCHLLLNAVYEVHYFIDNSDVNDKITKQQIAQIAVNAFFAEDRMTKVQEKRKYIINGLYCAKHGISKKAQAIKIINEKKATTKQNNMEQIKTLYNPNISDTQNLQLLAENGVNISLRTYKQYKKEMGLSKTYNKRPTSDQMQKDNEVIETTETSAERANEMPINGSVEQMPMKEETSEENAKETPIYDEVERANKSVVSVEHVSVEQMPTQQQTSAERAEETPNNEDTEYNDLMLKVQALKTEEEIKHFDFNAYYDTLKKHDIIKMIVCANGDTAQQKAAYLKGINYIAFILFLQQKINSKMQTNELIKILNKKA